jgi:hypothetical protein
MLAVYCRESSLARINFIKSRLVYESFSDCSKDVDLVSQEILLLDTRFAHCPANKETQLLPLSFHLVIITVVEIRSGFNADPDLAFYLNADPDPGGFKPMPFYAF